MTQNSPPLVLPTSLCRTVAALQDKDRNHLDDTITQGPGARRLRRRH